MMTHTDLRSRRVTKVERVGLTRTLNTSAQRVTALTPPERFAPKSVQAPAFSALNSEGKCLRRNSLSRTRANCVQPDGEATQFLRVRPPVPSMVEPFQLCSSEHLRC